MATAISRPQLFNFHLKKSIKDRGFCDSSTSMEKLKTRLWKECSSISKEKNRTSTERRRVLFTHAPPSKLRALKKPSQLRKIKFHLYKMKNKYHEMSWTYWWTKMVDTVQILHFFSGLSLYLNFFSISISHNSAINRDFTNTLSFFIQALTSIVYIFGNELGIYTILQGCVLLLPDVTRT